MTDETRAVHLPPGRTPYDTIDALKAELAAKTEECELLKEFTTLQAGELLAKTAECEALRDATTSAEGRAADWKRDSYVKEKSLNTLVEECDRLKRSMNTLETDLARERQRAEVGVGDLAHERWRSEVAEEKLKQEREAHERVEKRWQAAVHRLEARAEAAEEQRDEFERQARENGSSYMVAADAVQDANGETAKQFERAEAAEREQDEALKLLKPKAPQETLCGAIRNLQQAHLSEKGNADRLEAQLAAVDAVLARRTAFDGFPDRVDKILYAITSARVSDPNDLRGKLNEAKLRIDELEARILPDEERRKLEGDILTLEAQLAKVRGLLKELAGRKCNCPENYVAGYSCARCRARAALAAEKDE